MHRHRLGMMEVDSPPATRLGARHENDNQESLQGTIYKAIQTIENVLRGGGFFEIVETTWEHVKKAALRETGAQGRQDASGYPTQAQDIQDIKDSLSVLTKELKNLKEQGKARKPTYAKAAQGQEPPTTY